MTGSLQIKRDIFYIVLNVYDATGKRKPKWVSTGLPVKGNKKRAEKLLRETLAQYEAMEGFHGGEEPFVDTIRRWMGQSAHRVDPVTLQGYALQVDKHILPYFQALGLTLAQIDFRVLQTYLDEKHLHGRLDGKGGLSPKSLQAHKNILNQVLKEAMRQGLIPRNPCELVVLPKRERHRASFYSADQVNRLLEACREDVLYPLLRLTAVYGLRRSEVLGLQWDSVDFEANTLTIQHTVVKLTELVEKDTTKNASSHRTFPLLPDIRNMLLTLQKRERDNRRLFKSAYHDTPYILKWDDGRPFSTDYVSHHFKKLLEKHGFPPLRFHELRHSCASILINQGATLKDVQEWMGHADISVTADIYGHLDITRKQGIARMMEQQLGGQGVLDKC